MKLCQRKWWSKVLSHQRKLNWYCQRVGFSNCSTVHKCEKNTTTNPKWHDFLSFFNGRRDVPSSQVPTCWQVQTFLDFDYSMNEQSQPPTFFSLCELWIVGWMPSWRRPAERCCRHWREVSHETRGPRAGREDRFSRSTDSCRAATLTSRLVHLSTLSRAAGRKQTHLYNYVLQNY